MLQKILLHYLCVYATMLYVMQNLQTKTDLALAILIYN